MGNSAVEPPGTTERTRRAILDAAVSVYARDRNAPLRDIARAARVGRSTLHRYFPDRMALLHALVLDAVTVTQRSMREAALDQGSSGEALQRAVHALFDLGPRLNFLFNESPQIDDYWGTEWEQAHGPIASLFVRGQQDGAFDPEMDVEWFVRMMWYAISAGWEAVQEGAMPKHRAVDMVARSLRYGVSGPSRTGDVPAPGRPDGR